MLKKIAAALIASALISAPALAQGTVHTVNHAKPAIAKTHHVAKVKKHSVKKAKISKHRMHAKHVTVATHKKHIATTKPTMPAHHN